MFAFCHDRAGGLFDRRHGFSRGLEFDRPGLHRAVERAPGDFDRGQGRQAFGETTDRDLYAAQALGVGVVVQMDPIGQGIDETVGKKDAEGRGECR
jgi:hypothetical protein